MVLPSFTYIDNPLQINMFQAYSVAPNDVYLDEILPILRHQCGTRRKNEG